MNRHPNESTGVEVQIFGVIVQVLEDNQNCLFPCKTVWHTYRIRRFYQIANGRVTVCIDSTLYVLKTLGSIQRLFRR